MSTPKPASYRRLHDRQDRAVAHMAAQARIDTLYGGAKAIVINKRIVKMGGEDLDHVISDVYSASTGSRHRELEGWECPECGCAHLGQDAAYKCCAFSEEEES